LIIAQNEIMARLVIPFDDYLLSPNYKEWQDSQIEAEKQRRQQITASRQISRDNSVNFTSINGCTSTEPSTRFNTMHSRLNISNNTPTTTIHFTMGGNSLQSISGSASTTNLNQNTSPSPALLSDDFAICAADYPDVLIVDDSLVTLKITGLTLERDGHNVERASNGQIALQLMKSRPYDVVLIDCNMPVMDGLETIKRIREDEAACAMEAQEDNGEVVRARRQLVIGVSADSDTETRDTALRAGMDAYVDKPLDIGTLKAKCLEHNLVL
jgi:CheY-like chemotaxis protein